MIRIRKASERGHFTLDWLETYHTFSFGEYLDRRFMGFRALRVINEDTVRPSSGFGTHPHRDMEMITYVLSGELRHRDSLGTGSTLRAGDVQRMSAGSGILHSEENPSPVTATHLFQIWIVPSVSGMAPSYEEKHFPIETKEGRLCLLVFPDGTDGALRIHQDVRIFASVLSPLQALSYPLRSGRGAWIQLAEGEIHLNGQRLTRSDGAAVEDESELRLEAVRPSELLLFDLP